MQTIRVSIDERTGRITVEGEGFVGKSCDKPLDAIARALGVDPGRIKVTHKPEYALESPTSDKQLATEGGQ